MSIDFGTEILMRPETPTEPNVPESVIRFRYVSLILLFGHL